jgi:hypothetical protein
VAQTIAPAVYVAARDRLGVVDTAGHDLIAGLAEAGLAVSSRPGCRAARGHDRGFTLRAKCG